MEEKSRDWTADERERGRKGIRRIKQKRSFMLHHANNYAFWCVCVWQSRITYHKKSIRRGMKPIHTHPSIDGGYMHAYNGKSAMCIFSISVLVPLPHCCSCCCCCRYCWWTQFLLGWGNIAVRMKRHIHIKLHATDRWPSLSRIHIIFSAVRLCACVCLCPCPCVCVGGVEICRSESKIQVHVVHDFILVHNVADLKTLLFIFTWMLKVFTHKCCGARWLAFIAGVVCSPFGCAHIPRKRLF